MNKKELLESLNKALFEIELIRDCQNNLITKNYWDEILGIQDELEYIRDHTQCLLKQNIKGD